MKTDTPHPIRLKDYKPPAYLVDHVRLDFKLDPRATTVKSELTMRRNPSAGSQPKQLWLDGEGLELVAIAIDGRALEGKDYAVTSQGLTIRKPPASRFRLSIETRIDPSSNTALQGLYRSRGVYCTQCEAEGFRRITYFPDRPDVLATYRVRVEADPHEAPILLSNGNPVERGTLDGGSRHYTIWDDPHPKPSYLFALVGGDLAPVASTFKTCEGNRVDLTIYVEHGKEARAGWAMDSLKRSMRWDEERFGRAYDLDVFNIVAVSDFNMGAMENKGLNIFNDRLILASAETATDTSFAAIESVVAHEYFHNWTGNRITCRDWFQLCLKEGLTVYRDQEFSADERSAVVQRIGDVRQLMAHQFPEDAGPLAHPVRPDSYIEINNFYTATVYEKGAELVRMIATIIGEAAFRAGMDLYFDRHDGEAATVEDFLSCFEEASGRDLSQFARWYSQAGTPQVDCVFAYDANSQIARLTLEQSVPPTPGQQRKKPHQIPVKLGLLGPEGVEYDLRLKDGEQIDDGVVQLTKAQQTFEFTDIPQRPVPSLLRGFSAPVILRVERTKDDLAFLLAHDSDAFSRWQSANEFATRVIIERVRALEAGKRSQAGRAFADALGKALSDGNLEPAYRAELLKLPSASDIAREIGKDVNPDLVWRAQRQLSRLVARELAGELEALYREMRDAGPFSADAEAAGRRSLRNTALSLLTSRGSAEDHERVAAHYAQAANMTDKAHALYLLASLPRKFGQAALDDFHDAWKCDHVVIDTWFAAQAQSSRGDTLRRVIALTKHDLFSLRAPNKVRALIGNFALQNPLQFNRPDGAGYAFLADQILALDPINPQIAARLLGAMRSWRSLEPERRKAARKHLRRIKKAKDLSRDVFEIVTKILDE